MENNNFVEEKFEEVKNKKQQELNPKKSKVNKKKVTIIALLLAGVVLLGTLSASLISKLFKNDNKNNKDNEPKNPEESTIIIDTEIGADDLGMEEEIPLLEEENKEFGDVTGDISKDEIVTDENGNNWVNEEAADKFDEIGKETFDDQNGTLEKDEDGDIVEKDENFEITDENGNEVSNGSNESGTPDDYEYDEELDKVVDTEDVNKFVYVDADYYDMNGNLVYTKGEIVLKETLEKIKNDSTLTTIKPEVSEPEQTIPEQSEPEVSEPTDDNQNEAIDSYGGVVNNDGTYTIYGITYMDKATFEAFVLDENSQENFGFYNNIIYPVSVIEEMIQTKSNTK